MKEIITMSLLEVFKRSRIKIKRKRWKVLGEKKKRNRRSGIILRK